MDYLDDLFAEEDEKAAKKDLAKNLAEESGKKEEPVIEIPKCDHTELYKSICLQCDQQLSHFQIYGRGGEEDVMYREYALLGRGKDILIRSDFAPQFIQKQVDQLFEDKKLVLVLDLDNTLIHATDRGTIKGGSKSKVWAIDGLKDIYGAEMNTWRYEIKCRPFLKEFMVGVLPYFEIYFYTAGLRAYGKLIMEIIKGGLIGEVTDELKGAFKQTFKDERLIARDDNQRFQSQYEKSKHNQEIYNSAAGGGDATLKMKNVFKSLKALAGDNEKIFVILDDRDDVWLDENKQLPQNLLRIPGYYYYDTPNITNRFQSFTKIYYQIAQKFDIDLTLLTFKSLLLDIHAQFFNNFESKKKIEKLTDVRYYITRNVRSLFQKCNFTLNFEYFTKKGLNAKTLEPQMILPPHEINLCKAFSMAYVSDPENESETENQIYIVGDYIPESEQEKWADKDKLSILWLYLSTQLMQPLPTEPFKQIRTSGSNDQDSELHRIKHLMIQCLGIMYPKMHALYVKQQENGTTASKPINGKRSREEAEFSDGENYENSNGVNKIQKIQEVENKENGNENEK